jgi:hypothetical protein
LKRRQTSKKSPIWQGEEWAFLIRGNSDAIWGIAPRVFLFDFSKESSHLLYVAAISNRNRNGMTIATTPNGTRMASPVRFCRSFQHFLRKSHAMDEDEECPKPTCSVLMNTGVSRIWENRRSGMSKKKMSRHRLDDGTL